MLADIKRNFARHFLNKTIQPKYGWHLVRFLVWACGRSGTAVDLSVIAVELVAFMLVLLLGGRKICNFGDYLIPCCGSKISNLYPAL